MIKRPMKNRFYVMVAKYKGAGGRYKPVKILVHNRGKVRKPDGAYYSVVLVKYLTEKPEDWTGITRTKEELEKFGPAILAPCEIIMGWEHTNQEEAAAIALAEVL